MATKRSDAQSAPTSATRLTFTYVGREVRLEAAQSIAMRTPPSHALETRGERAGFWFELRDAADRVLYRRITDHPLRFSVEVRTDDPERPLAHEALDDPRGTFVLLAPDLPTAVYVVLVGSEPSPEGPRGPAVELARLPLRGERESPG